MGHVIVGTAICLPLTHLRVLYSVGEILTASTEMRYAHTSLDPAIPTKDASSTGLTGASDIFIRQTIHAYMYAESN